MPRLWDGKIETHMRSPQNHVQGEIMLFWSICPWSKYRVEAMLCPIDVMDRDGCHKRCDQNDSPSDRLIWNPRWCENLGQLALFGWGVFRRLIWIYIYIHVTLIWSNMLRRYEQSTWILRLIGECNLPTKVERYDCSFFTMYIYFFLPHPIWRTLGS